MTAPIKKESLTKKLLRYINENKTFTLQELYEEFGEYKPHSVRARLYESDDYREKRVIKTENGTYALCGAEVEAMVECVDTREHIYRLTDAKLTYDLIVIDSPYQTAAQRGGNRQLTDFSFISPREFGNILIEAEKLLKDEFSQVVMMISGGKSGRRDVEKYLNMFDETNLKLSNRGSYTKYNANGKRANMGKYLMPEEQILSFSLSGKERSDIDTSSSTEYHFQRPPLPRSGGYSTEKPLGMMEAIIKRATREGERVLDLFTGSGVTLEAGLNLNRKVHGLEISIEAIKGYILPRVRKFEQGVVEMTEAILPQPQAVRQTSIFDFL